MLLCTSLMVGAVAWDVRRRAPTDGLHWAGVSVWLVAAAIQYMTYRFFF
jgi:hypothetical protein